MNELNTSLTGQIIGKKVFHFLDDVMIEFLTQCRVYDVRYGISSVCVNSPGGAISIYINIFLSLYP